MIKFDSVNGQTYADYIQAQFLSPLSMDNTKTDTFSAYDLTQRYIRLLDFLHPIHDLQ